MLATKNRAGAVIVSLLAVVVFLAGCAPPAPRALLAGKDLLDDGKTTEAIAALRTATDLMPTNAAAWNYLGVAYHRSGQWTNATAAYSQALRFNRELMEARFNLGCLWLELRNFEAAKADLFTYTSRRPNDGTGWVKLGSAQSQSGELAAAEKSFREALRVEATDVVALNGLGLVFAQRNRAREAADAFTAALKQQPDYRPALLNLATVLQQLNDRPGALQRYREYLVLQPRDGDWEAVSAIVRALEPTNGSRALIVTNSRPVVQAKPDAATNVSKPAITPAPVARVVSNTAPPPPEVVKISPEPVIKTNPDDQQAVSRTAPIASVSPATSSVTPVKTISPTPPEKKSLLSKLNPFKRDAKPSPTTTATSSSGTTPAPAPQRTAAPGRYQYLNPVAPAAGDRRAAEQALAQGQEAQRARRSAEAMQFFRRATNLDGSYFEAHYSLGLATFEARSFKAAAAAWETAIALRPDSSDARYNFALTLKAAGYPQDAADELEKLLSLHPDEARGHLTLGNLYAEQLGDKPRARRHYQQVLQLDPRNPQAQAIRYWLVANPG
ncbi:MAG: tetratricopeptide repeat protein [Verrucomicrobiota bacterium]